jgi:hypothetical protein
MSLQSILNEEAYRTLICFGVSWTPFYVELGAFELQGGVDGRLHSAVSCGAMVKVPAPHLPRGLSKPEYHVQIPLRNQIGQSFGEEAARGGVATRKLAPTVADRSVQFVEFE